MIYTSIDDVLRYEKISENLHKAIKYITEQDLSKLPLGRTEVSGDEIFINRMSYKTIEESQGFFEAHLDYIDIHIVLEGREKVFVSDVHSLKEVKRDLKEDFIEYQGAKELECLLDASKVLIVFPRDAHMVKVKDKEEILVEKVVVKVKIH